MLQANLVRMVLIGSLLTLIAGCSGEVDDEMQPAELKEFKAEMQTPVLWRKDVSTRKSIHLKLAPFISKDRIFVASDKGLLQVMDVKTGKVFWKKELKLRISSPIGGDEQYLAMGSLDADVIMLEQAHGDVKWRTKLSSEVLTRPILTADKVIVRTGDGKLYGLDRADGRTVWVYDRKVPALSLRGNSSPIADTKIVYAGFDNGKLVAFNLTDGKVEWESTLSVPAGRSDLERMVDVDADPLLVDGILYVVSFQGRVAAISTSNGRMLWYRELSSYAGLAVDAHFVYLSDASGVVWALDKENGATVWKHDHLKARDLTAPVVHDNSIVVGDYDGYLHWLDKKDGRIVARLRIGNTAVATQPMVVEKVLFARTRGGTISAVQVKSLYKDKAPAQSG